MKKKPTATQLAALLGVACMAGKADAVTSFQEYCSPGNNLIHISTADFDTGNAVKKYPIGMTVDGKVLRFPLVTSIGNPNNVTASWTNNTGQFGFMLATADIGTDGVDEILVPGADGHLRIIDKTGSLVTNLVVSSGALYCVDVGTGVYSGVEEKRIIVGGVDGNLDLYAGAGNLKATKPISPQGVIRRVVAGNFDGSANGSDEVAVFYNHKDYRGECYIDVVTLSDGNSVVHPWYWSSSIEDDVDDFSGNGLGWTDKQLPWAYDMDEDGKMDVVGHWGVMHPNLRNSSGATTLTDLMANGEEMALGKYTSYQEGLPNRGKYIAQQGIPGNFTSAGGTEMFTLYGNYLYLLNYDTNKADTAWARLKVTNFGYAPMEFEFSDGARLESGSGLDKIILTGPINGDDHFYVADLSGDWDTQSKTIGTTGKLHYISDNLDELEGAVTNFTGTWGQGDPISVLVPSVGAPGWWTWNTSNLSSNADLCAADIQSWRDAVSVSGNPTKVVFYAFASAETNANVTPWRIGQWCKALAARKIHCCLSLGMHNEVYLTEDQVVSCFTNSINASDGKSYLMFRALEARSGTDMDKYTTHIDALIAKANSLSIDPPKLVFDGKGPIYATMTTTQKDSFFTGNRKDVVVLGSENSNVRLPELSFAEKVGLWLNGDINWWCCDVIGDNLSANRVVEFGGMANGHVILRQLLSGYAMGASIFRLNSVCEKEDLADPTQWSKPYRQGLLTFCKIVEKRVFPAAPSVDRLKGVSPVAIAMPIPNRTHLKKQEVDHRWDTYTPLPTDRGAFDQLECWHAYTKVPANDASAFLFNTTWRWDNLLPTSPCGFVPVVPFSDGTNVEGKAWCNVAYETDGDVWVEFASLTAAKNGIEAELTAQRSNMLFYVDGTCFWQVTQQKNDTDTYFAMVMDHNTLAPNGGTVKLKKGTAAGSWNVYDQLTNPTSSLGTLSTASSEISISIPMGSVRFLVLKKQ